MTLRALAQTAIDHGISVVPARMDGTKRPAGEWKQYQLRHAAGAELDTWFHDGQEAIGVICGRISGGLEMLEFEGRALAQGLGSKWRDSLLEAGHAELYRRVTDGYSERTPSGGVHILYRCEQIEGNKKLARSDDGVLIETRGEGGFVVIAPTTGNCHPTGNPWQLVKGGIETIATITPEERQILHDHARLLDETPVRSAPDGVYGPQTDRTDERPGDRYNADPDALKATYDLLVSHGWQHHHQGRDGTYYLTRPGKPTKDGWSATLGHPKTGGQGFYVFTTSDQFEAEHSYSPFQVLTILEHDGDYSAAARALAAEQDDEPIWEVTIGANERPEPEADPDLDDFINQPEPDYDWLVEGLIERGDRVILTGSEGAGKSTLLRQAAVTIGSGIHPFSGEPIPPQRVLYIDLENSTRHVRRQLRPLRIAAGKRLEPGGVIPLIRPEGLDLLDNEDRHWLEDRIQANQPDILIIGPIYKLAGGDPTEEQPAKVVATLLDRFRTEYGFAVLMEAHSPHGEGGKKRPKRPYGASLWLRWPEFGLHIDENGNLTHWRGARDERAWPTLLKRGGEWPWTLAIAPQDILWGKIQSHSQTQMTRPTIRQLEAATGEPKTSIHRVLKAREAEWNALFPGDPI